MNVRHMKTAVGKLRDLIPGFAAAVCLMALVAAPVDVSSAQQETVRVQTTLVQVPVIVSDLQGGSVLGLKAEDFVLRDDGMVRPPAFFTASSEPLKVALVLDTSKSTVTVLPGIRQAALDFVSHLRPQDKVMVAAFDFDVRVLCRFGTDLQYVTQALRNLQPGDYVGTKMYDAVTQVAGNFFGSGQERKAMILLTDGQDYGSRASMDGIIRTVLDAGVVVYPVFYSINRRELAKKLFGISLPKSKAGNEEWEKTEKAAAGMLQQLAEESAGALYRSDAPNLKKAFSRITEELRHQYLLAFYPDPARVDGQPHAIRVEVSRPNLTIRFRRSYLATKSAK